VQLARAGGHALAHTMLPVAYIYVFMSVRVSFCVCVRACVCIHICISRTHKHIHTHMHMRAQINTCSMFIFISPSIYPSLFLSLPSQPPCLPSPLSFKPTPLSLSCSFYCIRSPSLCRFVRVYVCLCAGGGGSFEPKRFGFAMISPRLSPPKLLCA